MFSELKAAQVAAYFAFRNDGTINVLSLMKLMYIAERESYREWGEPMIGDYPVSMPHGPVLSLTLSHTNGEPDHADGGWDDWIADRANYSVSLKRGVADPKEDLGQLSDSDLSILDRVWEQFGHMANTPFALRDWTHANCPEWVDPEGSSRAISPESMFQALGFSPEQVAELSRRLLDQRRLHQVIQHAA